MRKNRIISSLLIFFGLSVFIFSCSDEEVATNSNCGQVDVKAASIFTNNGPALTLYSGGYTETSQRVCILGLCQDEPVFTTIRTTFENNLSIKVDYQLYNLIESTLTTETKQVTVNKGESSEKVILLAEGDQATFNYAIITNVEIKYLDECPKSTNTKRIAGTDVPKIENTEAEVIVRLGQLDSKTISSFTIAGTKIFTTDESKLTEYGIVYLNTNTEEFVTSTGSLAGFSSEVTGLEPDTKYNVRAYAIQNGTTYYSTDYIEVTTNAIVSPTVVVGDDVKDITATSLTVAGNSVTGGDPASSEFGVAYSLTNDTDAIVEHISGAGSALSFEVSISELTANTSYYVWAYAKQNGIYVYSETSVLATTSAAIPSVIFNGVSYRIDGGDYISYTTDGISYMAISMHRYNGEVQDFNVGIELRSNDGFKSGTYTFGTGDLYFNDVTTVALDNTQDFKKATGGTITLTINENKDYTVVMNVQTEGGELTGTYTVLGEFGSEF